MFEVKFGTKEPVKSPEELRTAPESISGNAEFLYKGGKTDESESLEK
jgi:hypothetical protein